MMFDDVELSMSTQDIDSYSSHSDYISQHGGRKPSPHELGGDKEDRENRDVLWQHGYKVLNGVGKGAFGRIYRVSRTSNGEVLACKCVRYSGLDARQAQQLVDEVNAMRSLKILSDSRALTTPSMAGCSDALVQYEGRIIDKQFRIVFIFMELCAGGDLGAVLEAKRNAGGIGLPEDLVWQCIEKMAMALEMCNHASIVHRDVKPSNVFLANRVDPHDHIGDDEHWNFKLGDFGLARLMSDDFLKNEDTENNNDTFSSNTPPKTPTQMSKHHGKASSSSSSSLVGSPYYMSPEQIRCAPSNSRLISTKCDVWSLGCVAFELCTLRLPFEAKTYPELQCRIERDVLDNLPFGYSSTLNDVLHCMMHKDPSKRPSPVQLLSHPAVVLARKARLLHIQARDVRERDLKLALRSAELSQRERELEDREEAVNRAMEQCTLMLDSVKENIPPAVLSRLATPPCPTPNSSSHTPSSIYQNRLQLQSQRSSGNSFSSPSSYSPVGMDTPLQQRHRTPLGTSPLGSSTGAYRSPLQNSSSGLGNPRHSPNQNSSLDSPYLDHNNQYRL